MRKQLAVLLGAGLILSGLSITTSGVNAAWFGKKKQVTQIAQPQKLVPAFPGAAGAGMYVTGGRGGKVYEVTTLADYAKKEKPIPGSLRAAVSGSNRMIVFRVGGVIHLKETLKITGNNLTIAGQTAPGDGIAITDYEIIFGSDKAAGNDSDIMKSATGNNIIMRYLRVRPGDRGKNLEVDATWARWHHDIMIDHCSFGWSSDETLSIYGCINTTVQWCLVAESMTMSKHDKGRHGYGAILGGKYATAHHNLIASNTSRSPRIDGQGKLSETATDFINNVIYNWGFNSLYGGQGYTHTNVIGNYYKPGPGTQNYTGKNSNDPKYNTNYRIANTSRPGNGLKSYWYIRDNYVAGYPAVTADNAKGVYCEDPQNTVMTEKPNPVPHPPVIEPAEKAYEAVLAQCGATLPKRDPLDQRLINDVKNGAGRFINTPPEAGGMPEFSDGAAPADTDHDGMPDAWEKANGFNPNNAKDGAELAANGYTNVENYLNALVVDAAGQGRLNPSVSLSAPSLNQLAAVGQPITFKATAAALNSGAKIAKVAFYDNDLKLGEVTAAPYEFVWKNATEGTHYLSAVATDDLGYRTQSNLRVVHVNEQDHLVSGWQTVDLGAAPLVGNTVFKGADVIVKGSGRVAQPLDPTDKDQGTRDSCRFVYRKVSAQATLIAKVTDFTFVDNSATSGLMIRKSLEPDAPMALISLQLEKAGKQDTGKAIVVRAREQKGGRLIRNDQGQEYLGFYNHAAKGYWMRLKRDGANLETAYSQDGQNWLTIWKGSCGLGKGEVYLGMAADAAQDVCQLHNYNRVVFANVTLSEN
jgi:hypothetical protein